MSAGAVLVVAEGIVAVAIAWRSRPTLTRLSLLVWAVHLTATLLVLRFPASGAWARLMEAPSPGQMLAVAATVLALLLFTANFFHGAAKPDKDAEQYFGVVLDTYLSTRSRLTSILFTESFQIMICALFVVPLFLPWVQTREAISRIAMAAWFGCLGLVFGVLLVNAIIVLRVSLRRLLNRGSIRRNIRIQTAKWFDRNLRDVTSDPLGKNAQALFSEHLSDMIAMPVAQQYEYFRETLGSLESAVFLEKRIERAIALTNSSPWRGRRLCCLEWLRGNLGGRADQAREIHKSVKDVQWALASAIAEAWPSFKNVGVRSRLLRQLAILGRSVDAHHDKFDDQGALHFCGVGEDRPLGRSVAVVPMGWASPQPVEKVLEITMACFRQIIDFRFPADSPSQCTLRELLELSDNLKRVRHSVTRKALLALFAERTIRSTITRRAEGELLAMDTLRDAFLEDARRRTRASGSEPIGEALVIAAFSASVEMEDIPEDARLEVLEYLDVTDTVTSLIYQLQYLHRSHQEVDAPRLRPYSRQLDYRRFGDELEDVESDRLHAFLDCRIGYFCSPDDVDWLLTCLGLPVDAEFVAQYRQHVRTDLSLSTALLWRGTAKNIEYAWASSTTRLGASSFLQQRQLARTLVHVAGILDEIDSGRGGRLLANNSWAMQGD